MKKLLLLVAMVATFIGLSAQNPYAYKLSAGNQNDEGITIHYTLNAAAQTVQIQLFDGETQVKAIDMGEGMLTAGDHEYVLNFAENPEIPAGKPISWKVAVTGEAISAPVQLTDKLLKFYSPAGVAVDVNPESDNFGTMYVTESYASADTEYYTAPNNNAVGIGLYQFDPQFNGIQNENGKYGFSCGMQSAGTTLVDWRPSRIQISKDGRMFILSQRVNYAESPLWEINRSTLQASKIMQGELDSSNGKVFNGDVEVSGGAGVAFDVYGTGENLKIALTTTNGTSIKPADYKTVVYNLGSATTWDAAPSQEVTAFAGKLVNYAGINLAYDEDGGLWFSQYRGSPSNIEPAMMHTNDMVNADYTNTSYVIRNGGMAYNKDKTLLAMSIASKNKIGIFKPSKDADGNMVLGDPIYTFTVGFTGFNQFAFDYANNLISCDNSSEFFGMFQIPNEDVVVATPCIEEYYFEIPAEEPAGYEEFYLVGTFNDWSQEEGMVAFEGNEAGDEYTATVDLEANALFKVITPDGDNWKWFGGQDDNGVGYFLINDAIEEVALVNGANFKVEEAGKFTFTIKEAASKGVSEPLVMTVAKTSAPPTAITTISNDKVDNAWYNMSGIRFESKPTAPGIYIHNGKKVIIK